MKEIYSNKIFNWIILIVSVLTLIETSYRLTKEFEFFNVLTLRIILFIVPILSIFSLFIKKLNKEFYSRLFIIVNLIALQIAIYFQFLVDQLFYLVTRTDLISNPILHINFIIGLVLFFLSIRFSKTPKIERQSEYGIMIILYGIFLIVLNFTKFFDYDSVKFSMIKFVIKFLLIISIIFFANKLRTEKLKFKTTIIIFVILTIINGML